MWNDTNAAFPDNETNYEEQYYYIIRAVNKLGEISTTSRTVGKWTRAFPQGVSTFSLPLEPLETMNTTIDHYLKDMNATYIRWMDPIYHYWMKHGDNVVNDTLLEVGPLTGNITLNWTKPSSKGVNNQYHVLRSIERDRFWSGNYVQLATLTFDELTYTDVGNATAGTQFYYMIVPVNETGVEGASTYSIGVWTANFSEQYDTIGTPLKVAKNETVDWYCDNIPDTVGINYYNVGAQRWSWHSARMPKGAFDPVLVMTGGYQISTSGVTKFTFVGI